MKKIDAGLVRSKVAKLIVDCLTVPDKDVTRALDNIDTDSDLERTAAALIAKNNKLAEANGKFCCQDTGQALFFVELGDEAYCPGLHRALELAVADGYSAARKSVADPITRINSGDNCPPIVHTTITDGDALTVTFLAKGAGSENMTKLYMLAPADGEVGITESVVDAVSRGGRNACPPLIVGVGIGGVAETACVLSKKATLRPLGTYNPRADVAELEKKLLGKVNELGIGVGAWGGRLTALAVNIEVSPTHIGMLPVAVDLQCHSLRRGSVTFY